MVKKRKRPARRKKRFPWRRLLTITAAVVAAYAAWSQERAIRLGPETQRVYAAFARSGLNPIQFARMRESPLPPVHKPAGTHWRTIREVLDGDTVRLDDGTTIRLLGIDAPESSENRKLYTDLGKMNLSDAKATLIGLGRAAKKALAGKATGKRCWLESETAGQDQYGRSLAVVHLEDGTILNEWLVMEGYAKAHLTDPFPYRKRYLAMQMAAQRRQRGFWSAQEADPE